MVIEADTPGAHQRDALVDKLVRDTIASFELMGTYLGLRLGLYAALEDGPATSTDLASRTDIDERYAREWLEQQAVAGMLVVDDPSRSAGERSFRLPTDYGDVLVNEESPYFVAPLAFASAIGGLLPDLVESFRSGSGIPFEAYGPDMRDHIEQLNRPMFLNELASDWLPAIPELHERFRSDPPAQVLDIACGSGWSSIAVAKAYPKVRVVGLDLDEASIDKAKRNASASGVEDRVTFRVSDAIDVGPSGSYDAAFIFEALHDMSQPVVALAAARRALVPGGALVVGDEKVAEQFTAPGDELERLMYGFSITHCLPVGRTGSDSAATGTVMRPDTLRAYAQEAGFSQSEVIPIDHEMWRFYKLSG